MKHHHKQPVGAGHYCKLRLDVQFVGWYAAVRAGRLGGTVASKFGVEMHCDK
jgi:hypothetical protein